MGFTPAAMAALCEYDFPGNVREMENIIERTLLVCQSDYIDLVHLPPEITAKPTEVSCTALPPSNREDQLRQALVDNQWNRENTARALSISRTTLWRLMKKNGLL